MLDLINGYENGCKVDPMPWWALGLLLLLPIALFGIVIAVIVTYPY